MDYDKLLNMATELGYQLMSSGAEIYRAEESVYRLLRAYGLEHPQVFAIPNALIVSVTTPQGHPITRMSRIPSHGTDIERLERCNDLCRRLCFHPIPLDEAQEQISALSKGVKSYHPGPEPKRHAFFLPRGRVQASFNWKKQDISALQRKMEVHPCPAEAAITTVFILACCCSNPICMSIFPLVSL